MEDYLLFAIWLGCGIFLIWVLCGIYKNTSGSYFRKKSYAKGKVKNQRDRIFSLYKVKEYSMIIDLNDIVIKQHRYRYDMEGDTLALDYIAPSDELGDLMRYSTSKYSSDDYSKYQNRIDYIESLRLNEILIPVLCDNTHLLATVVMEMDRDNLAIYLALEKEVAVSITKYIYQNEIKEERNEYECKFDFKFLKEVFEKKPIYYSSYIN